MVLLLCFALLVTPGLFSLGEHWDSTAKKTVFDREFDSNLQIAKNILHNFLLFYKNYDYMHNHFIFGPYLDMVTCILFSVGLILAMVRVKREAYLLLLLAYAATAILLGLLSPYSYAPVTRGIFYIPFGCAIAALALDAIRSVLGWKAVVPLILVIAALNVYRGHYKVFREVGHHAASLAIKEMQALRGEGSRKRVVLSTSMAPHFHVRNFTAAVEAYGLGRGRCHFLRPNELSCEMVRGRTVLMLEGDTKAIRALEILDCAESYTIKKLTHYYAY
jgi:hypothetical protein